MAATGHGRRLLFLAPVFPSDRGNGLAMRTGFFLEAYARVFHIDLIIIPFTEPTGPITEFIRRRVHRVKILPVQKRDAQEHLEVGRHAQPLLTGMLTIEARREVEASIDSAMSDVIHLSRLYLAELVAPSSKGRCLRASFVLDCDEDDAGAYRRIAATERRRGNNRIADCARAEAAGFECIAR